MKVGVLDYGVGNLGSVISALAELGESPLLIERAADVHLADSLILPGVGGFAACKEILDRGGWTDAVLEQTLTRNKPILGICLGMQLLADFGDEGGQHVEPTAGLGLIPGRVVSLKSLGCQERLPHVGWNSISLVTENHLLQNVPTGTDFYFVHSYAFVPSEQSNLIATVNYGVDFAAVVSRGNVWGTQFHPEKSSKAGFRLLRNFVGTRTC